MKIQVKQIILSLILFGMYGPGFSQESNEKALSLTLKEAQDYAVKHNRTVWNAGLSVSEAQKKTWEAISSGLPQVNATVDYQNMMGFKMELFGQSIALEPTSNFQATVSQLLFSASYWAGIKMSKIGEQMSETARLQSELDVKQQTQTAYQSILIAEENKKILGRNLENIQTLAKNTEDMVRVGVAEQTDADQLKVQVATVMNGIKTVERHAELAYNLLRFQLGVDTDAEITLTQTLEDLITARDTEGTVSTTFDPDNNYNVQLLDQQINLAGKQVSLEKAASLPTVSAFYSYTYKIKKSSFDMSPNNIIGLNASIPIFASGQRHVRTQQAKIQLETAHNNRTLLTDQLLMQEKQLRFNLNNAVESFELQEEALEVSQRVFESITRKFQQGTASSMDVTTANTSLLQAQTNYINAMLNVFTAQTELETLLNTL
jgi:outer membrane protein TolC